LIKKIGFIIYCLILLTLFLTCCNLLYGNLRTPSKSELRPDSTLIYTVKSGDNLYSIAGKYLNYAEEYFLTAFINKIKEINYIDSTNIIHQGQKLLIPLNSDVKKKRNDIIIPEEIKGVYLNPNILSTKKLKNVINQYDILGFNTVVIDFKNIYGHILYPTENKLALENGCCKPVIANPNRLIDFFHSHNIAVHARIVMFKDTTMASAHRHWRPQNGADTTNLADGAATKKTYKWCNPNSEEVQSYNLDIIKEVIKFRVDGIQLDYVRFPTENFLLKADYGIPDSVNRSEVITGFVKKVYKITTKYGVPLAADIFGIVAFQNEADVHNTGQDLTMLEPYLDRIHPMIYPSHFFGRFWNKQSPVDQPYYFIYRTCKRLQQILKNPEKVVPYLEAFSLYDPNPSVIAIILQLQATHDSGITGGYLFWNGYSRYISTWRGAKEYYSPAKFYRISALFF